MAETITAAVGTAPASNRPQDVETIQSMLNQVPPNQGGPTPLLDADGMVGPLTIGAIKKFQKFHFGFQDGRVDPNQKTHTKLNEFDLDPTTGNPVKFQEFQPNFGFDPAGQFPGTAAWQMVPLQGSKLVRVVGGGGVSSVTSNNPGIARPLFLGAAVQIFGVAAGSTVIKLRGAGGRVLARLDVTVKRKRTMKTSFFFVQDNVRKTNRTAGEVATLLQGMNDIMLVQANVEFVQAKVVDPLRFNDDFGTEVLDASALPAANRPRDEWNVIARRRDPNANFNVFFVTELEQDVNPATDSVEASTGVAEKSCLVEDGIANGAPDVIVAHEAGHGMGLDHDNADPNNLMNPAPFATSKKLTRRQIDRINRL